MGAAFDNILQTLLLMVLFFFVLQGENVKYDNFKGLHVEPKSV